MSSHQLVLGVVFWLLLLAFSVTAETTITPEQVLTRYFQSTPETKERKDLLKELEDLEKPYVWWFKIYNNPYVGSELRWLTLQKLLDTAQTFEECDALWPSVPLARLKPFFNIYMALSQTIQQRFAVYKKVYQYEWIYEDKARKELLKSQGTLKEWVCICLSADPLSILETETMEKIKKFDEPFEKWTVIASLAKRDSKLWQLAVDKMFLTAKCFDHAYEILQKVQGDDGLEKKAFKLMVIWSENFVQKLIIF